MVQLLCGSGLVDGPLRGEVGGGEPSVGGVGSVDVVVDPPVLDEHAGFEQVVEVAAVEELIGSDR